MFEDAADLISVCTLGFRTSVIKQWPSDGALHEGLQKQWVTPRAEKQAHESQAELRAMEKLTANLRRPFCPPNRFLNYIFHTFNIHSYFDCADLQERSQ